MQVFWKKNGKKFVSSKIISTFALAIAQMAESVDALVSNTSGAIHPGSIPGLGTKMERSSLLSFFRLYTLLYIYTYNIIIYPLISYHIPHFTKTFTAIYLE